MDKRVSVSAAQAKAQFSSLMAEVAYGGKHVIIERRGKPVAALVSTTDLEHLEQGQATSAQPQGALALVGAWREVEDEDLDALIADIYTGREQDTGRLVGFEA
ncbi:type II toxin-antitoxin system Phd/YefM family antitoxin [Dehalococcoidia bacterium]|nr:type II toxin-antitoxin system Phd/YefM family antitoxin [Dehalococcoidia bacterium]